MSTPSTPNANKVRIVAQKSYSAIGNDISGIPVGPAIDYMLPQPGMLTQYGLIDQVLINGAGSGNICLVGTGGGTFGLQPSGYYYTDSLRVYSGVALQFGWVGFMAGSGLLGHLNEANIIGSQAQNLQIGYFQTQNGPTSFSLPKPGE